MFVHLLSNTRIKVHFLVILFVELCFIEMCSKLFQLYGLKIKSAVYLWAVCFRRYVIGRKCEWSSPKFKGFVRFLR